MIKVIFVHGINNENNSEATILHDWQASMQKGFSDIGASLPADIEFRAAFFGDVLAEETDSWKTGFSSASPMNAEAPDSDIVTGNEAALFLELQRANNISNDKVAEYLADGEDVPTADLMARGIHKRWLRAIARAIEDIVPTRGKYIARKFLRQAAAYLEKPGLKEKIDQLVYDQVFCDLDPSSRLVIISHSLGTVVSYALLRQHMNQLNAKLFLTMGSPLGIEIVKRRLGPPLRCLPNVKDWSNVSDLEDFVALHSELTENSFGCGQIRNHTMIDNGYDDAHSISMYLQQKYTAIQIAGAIN